MSSRRCPGIVEDAFAPLVEHFGYEWDIDARHERRTLADFEDQIPARLAAVLEADALWQTPVHVIDLHGERARLARQRMERNVPGIRVIYFGKGSGVLYRVFEEWAEAESGMLTVVGRSGATDAEPVPSVGVVVPARLVDLLAQRLEQAPADAPARTGRRTRVDSGDASPRRTRAQGGGTPRGRRSTTARGPRRTREPLFTRRRIFAVTAALLLVLWAWAYVRGWA